MLLRRIYLWRVVLSLHIAWIRELPRALHLVQLALILLLNSIVAASLFDRPCLWELDHILCAVGLATLNSLLSGVLF